MENKQHLLRGPAAPVCYRQQKTALSVASEKLWADFLGVSIH